MNIFLAFHYLASVISHSKKSYILFSIISSLSISCVLDIIYDKIVDNKTAGALVAMLTVIVIINVFIGIDFVTGIMASRKEKQILNSNKVGATIAKCFGIILYLVVGAVVIIIVPDNYLVETIVFTPIILTMLKEYISIGENLERIYGKKSYMFRIVDKVFDLLEGRFFKNLEDKADDVAEKLDNIKPKDKTIG